MNRRIRIGRNKFERIGDAVYLCREFHLRFQSVFLYPFSFCWKASKQKKNIVVSRCLQTQWRVYRNLSVLKNFKLLNFKIGSECLGL